MNWEGMRSGTAHVTNGANGEASEIVRHVAFGEAFGDRGSRERLDSDIDDAGSGLSSDHSGRFSETSYDLVSEKDGGWRRRRLSNLSDGDQSLPLDEFNTPISDISDSMLDEICGIEDFQSSLEIDELNLSNEYIDFMEPGNPSSSSKGRKTTNKLVGSRGKLFGSGMGSCLGQKKESADAANSDSCTRPAKPVFAHRKCKSADAVNAEGSTRPANPAIAHRKFKSGSNMRGIESLLQSLRITNSSGHSRNESIDQRRFDCGS